jgi:hypothetical protein
MSEMPAAICARREFHESSTEAPNARSHLPLDERLPGRLEAGNRNENRASQTAEVQLLHRFPLASVNCSIALSLKSTFVASGSNVIFRAAAY